MLAIYKWAEFDIMFGKGISRDGRMCLGTGCRRNSVEMSGLVSRIRERRIGRDVKNDKHSLLQIPLICEEIENKVRVSTEGSTARLSPGEMVQRQLRRRNWLRRQRQTSKKQASVHFHEVRNQHSCRQYRELSVNNQGED